MNEYKVIGNLGSDPEVHTFPDGQIQTTLSVATDESFKDKQGNKVEQTEWHRVVLRGGQAEVAAKYLRKGSQVYVSGKKRTRKWTDNGQDHFLVYMAVRDMKLLDRAQSGASQLPVSQQAAAKPQSSPRAMASVPPVQADDFDDVPFALPRCVDGICTPYK